MKFFYVILGLLTIFGSSMVQAQTIKVCMAKGHPGHRVSRYVLERVYAEAGIDVEFIMLPNKRSLVTANNGGCAAEVSRIARVIRKFSNLELVPTPLRNIKAYAFKNIGANVSVANWGDLKGLKVAVVRGEVYAAEATKGLNPTIVDDYPALFRFLSARNIDVGVGLNVSVIDALSHTALRDKIEKLPTILAEEPVYHLVRKNFPQLNAKLNTVLSAWRKSGRLMALNKEAFRLLAANKI